MLAVVYILYFNIISISCLQRTTFNSGVNKNFRRDLSVEERYSQDEQLMPLDNGVLRFPSNRAEPSSLYDEEGSNKCVQITEPICRDLQYTQTHLPNAIGLASQEEAARRMNDYTALLSVGCSSYLKFFLCTVYFPMCVPTPTTLRLLQPCQDFCLYVQSKCEPIMKSFSFPWPKELQCSLFPPRSDMCIHPESYDLDQPDNLLHKQLSGVPANRIAELLPGLKNLMQEKFKQNDEKSINMEDDSSYEKDLSTRQNKLISNPKKSDEKYKCAPFEIQISSDQQILNVTCARLCSAHVFYRDAEKQFADAWILIWSLLCLASSFLTVVTFFIDRNRFTYPERPIVYISMCYLCYSLGYLLRIGLGRHRVACRERTENILMPSPQSLIKGATERPSDAESFAWVSGSSLYLIPAGHEGTWCTIVFITLYYFSQASYVWWVMLAVAWFLSTTCQWGCEGIEAVSSILHMLAWSLPALKTMIVLILHRIDANELTGLCNVGNQDPNSLLYFIVIPQVIYLVLGLALLVVGFFALISVRTNLRQHHRMLETTSNHMADNPSRCNSLHTHKTSKHSLVVDSVSVRRLDKLMAKMCIFSMLYIIPSICIISANLYNFNGYAVWVSAVKQMSTRFGCQHTQGTNWQNPRVCLDGLRLPSVEVHMLEVFMSLIIGITAGMWVWFNRKTFARWSHCCIRKPKFKISGTKLTTLRNNERSRTYLQSGSKKFTAERQVDGDDKPAVTSRVSDAFPSHSNGRLDDRMIPAGLGIGGCSHAQLHSQFHEQSSVKLVA